MQPPARGVLRLNLRAALALADLADRGDAGIFVTDRPEILEKLQIFRLGLVVKVILEVVGVHRWRRVVIAIFRRQRRVIAKLGVRVVEVDRIQAESVHTAL